MADYEQGWYSQPDLDNVVASDEVGAPQYLLRHIDAAGTSTTRPEAQPLQEWFPFDHGYNNNGYIVSTESFNSKKEYTNNLLPTYDIGVKYHFLATIMDDGRLLTSCSHGQVISGNNLSRVFNAAEFRRVVNELGQETDPLLDAPSWASHHTPISTTSLGGLENEPSPLFSQPPPATPSPVAPLTIASEYNIENTSLFGLAPKRITVSDAPAMWRAYKYLFGCCQQNMCKIIAKSWIRALSPKKHATHPYQGGQATAPGWWPTSCLGKSRRVRHRQPDHLYKRERINLLAHILRLVIEPSAKQHIAIRSLRLDVKRLKNITTSKLHDFLQKHDTTSGKKKCLAKIFELSQQEARFKNGDIGAYTDVHMETNHSISSDYLPSEGSDSQSNTDSRNGEQLGRTLEAPCDGTMILPRQITS